MRILPNAFRRRSRRRAKPSRLPLFTPVNIIRAYVKWPLLVILFIVTLLYGAAFALVAPFLLVPMTIPLVVLAVLVLWSLPEVEHPPLRALDILFFGFFVALIMWPGYLAIAIPGLPRVTPLRLVAIPVGLLFLICLSTSQSFRRRLQDVLSSCGPLWKVFAAFTVLQFASIAFSANTTSSIVVFTAYLTNGITLFFVGTYVFAEKNQGERFAALLCIMGVAISLLAVFETRLGHVPWAGHIPSLLQIDDPTIEHILAGASRAGYRAQGTFVTSLSMSEFLALTMPFLFHFAAQPYSRNVRLAALGAIPFVIYGTVLTQARTGLLGIAITVILYPLVLALLRARSGKSQFGLNMGLYLSPLLIAIGLGVGYAVPGIRIRMLGGGAAQLSNQGRTEQINMGIPKVLTHPWGYGVGQGAQALGFTNAQGFLTIDSYPLRLALEYGIVGFVLYYLQYVTALYYVAKIALVAPKDDKEGQLGIALGIAMVGFIAMQINFAQADSEPVMCTMLGMAAAFSYRYYSPKSLPELLKYRSPLSGVLASD